MQVHGGADQLARLKQGPPNELHVSLVGRPEGDREGNPFLLSAV